MHMRILSFLPVALLLSCAPPASAQSSGGSLEATAFASDGVRTFTLTCQPDGGTHPDPQAACAALTAAGGDLGETESLDLMCPQIYDPVRVTVRGQWASVPFCDEYPFPNLCQAKAATGGVLDFM